MALRNAVKVALISENEDPLSRARLDRPMLRFEERVTPAVVAAPMSDPEPLADALLWWVKEQLWLSEQPNAATGEPTSPAEMPMAAIIAGPATDAPSIIDAPPAAEATSPVAIEAPEGQALEPPAPLEPEPVVETPTPALIAESAADAPSPIDPLEVEAIVVPAPIATPPAPAIVIAPVTDAPPQLEPVVDARRRDTENPADPWRARAAATRTIAATLSQRSTALIIANIAALYDEIAEEAVLAPETTPVEMLRPRLPPDRYRPARR